jgi:MazG family protein
MKNIDRLLAMMARLRDPVAGCPWDREQSFATIAPYTIEEAYEVADAIDRHAMGDLRDELGDLLFQVVFHARIAEERGGFTFEDVAGAIADKMERRHPHVFGNAVVRTAAEQTMAWEGHKATERFEAGTSPSALDGIAKAMPALLRAAKLGGRAQQAGFDWPDIAGVIAKVREEIEELEEVLRAGEPRDRRSHEVGDLLFAVAQLARHLELAPETALREANARFERRFRWMEMEMRTTSRSPESVGLRELERLWQRAKQSEQDALASPDRSAPDA